MKKLGLSLGVSVLALAVSSATLAHEHKKEDFYKDRVEESIAHKENKHKHDKKMMKKKEFSHKENMKKEKHEYKKDFYKKHKKHMDSLEFIDVNYNVTLKGQPLFDGYMQLPHTPEKIKTLDEIMDSDVYDIPVGSVTYSQRFNPLASDEDLGSDTLFVKYDAEDKEVEFNIVKDGKLIYQTGVDYNKGNKAVRYLGDYKLRVSFKNAE
jgi:hypothetical protein